MGNTYTLGYVKGSDGSNGTNGSNGSNGSDGVGISQITGPVTNGNVDTYTIKLTNGTSKTFNVTNANTLNWEPVTLDNASSTFALYVNSALRLAELRMSYYTSQTIDTNEHSTSTAVPTTYRPSSVAVGSLQVGGSLFVSSAGAIKYRPMIQVGSGQYIHGSVMWHY